LRPGGANFADLRPQSIRDLQECASAPAWLPAPPLPGDELRPNPVAFDPWRV